MTDKRDLKPASENSWYVLMTVAGEQTRDKIDPDLHAQNWTLLTKVETSCDRILIAGKRSFTR